MIGVSDDDVESHKKFASKHRLQMTLLSDAGGRVRKEFGVTALFGVLPDRVTFVIDREGVVATRSLRGSSSVSTSRKRFPS